MKNLPKKLLRNKYRKELWKNAQQIIKQVQKALPLHSIHVLGSFTTEKKRPADVDFIILLKTKKNHGANWSADFVIAPDNKYGQFVLEDAKKWMKQKYGAKRSAVIKLK